MMRILLFFSLAFSLDAVGQVDLGIPIQMTGTDDQRVVQGLADPTSATALLSKGAFARGTPHWADAGDTPDGISLTLAPVTADQPNGTLLRFLAPATKYGPTSIQINDASSMSLVRPDGFDPVLGDITEGMVCEVILIDGRWILISPAKPGCPPQTAQVNERLCMDIEQSEGTMSFFGAIDHCAERGGRLCRWDEFFHACTTIGAEINGLFSDWEWIGDTSNHVHQGDQAGRLTCMSQRSYSPNALHATRCCYTRP